MYRKTHLRRDQEYCIINFVLDGIVRDYNKAESLRAEKEHREPVQLPHVSAHILRYTACSRLAESGIDAKTLQIIMGHALILWSLWDDEYAKQDEISSIQFDILGYGKIFGWNSEQEYKVLEALSDKGIVRLNRQLMPFTVLRLTAYDTLLNKLYSELC